MRKGLKKSAAFLLAVCMIFSLFAGVPMSVKAEDVPLTGLLVTDCIAGAGFVQGEGAIVTYSKYITADVSTEDRLYLKYADTEEAEGTPVTAGAITITMGGQSAEGKASVAVCEDNPNFCVFTFEEIGDYVVTYNGAETNNTITIKVHGPVLGFYEDNAGKTYINGGNGFDYESGKETTLYVVPEIMDEWGWTNFSYRFEADYGDTSCITVDGEALDPDKTYSSASTVKISAAATGDFGIRVISSYTYTDEESKKEVNVDNGPDSYLSCHEKLTGLVVAWPDDWNDEGPFVTEETEYGKYWKLNPKVTHILYFGTKEGEGTPAPYTGTLTITKVDGTTDADTAIIKHEENDAVCDGFYDVYFSENESGTYRITAGDGSSITVNVVEPDAGFYSSRDISMATYIDDQVLEYSETSNREFYFAIKKGDGIIRTIVPQDGGKLFDSGNNKDEVKFEQVNTSDESHDVYKITLGDKFEVAWKNQDFFNVKLNIEPEEGKAYENEFTVELCLNPVGLVAISPDWDKANDCAVYSHIPKDVSSIWKSYGTDHTEIVFFGYRDSETGIITPITDMNAVSISGNANIQKYEQNSAVPGFYEVTLLDYGKEYTFTYNGSSLRIYNTTPSSSGGGTTTGGGITSGGSTSDSNTTTETKPDGSTVETTTETKSDGTKVETITETKTDGTKVETSTETKTDGSKVETSTETKTDGSKTENIVETAADGSVKTTETVTKADGSATKTEKESETNTKGKEVAVTTTTKTDTTGAVTSVTEKSVIEKSSATTSTTVTVKKNGEGTITSASANVAKKVNSGNKATVSASIVSQIIEAAGTESVSVTMTVKDSEGKTKYKVKVEAENLQAGEELFIYKLNTKTGEYTMVNAKTYEVNESGNVSVSMTKKATYELVTAEDAAQIDKQIKSAIKPKKSSADVKPGKSTDFALSSKANEDNIKSITYTTSKKSVATVSKDGKITAKGKGTVTVKAKVTLKNGTTKTIKMTIKVK